MSIRKKEEILKKLRDLSKVHPVIVPAIVKSVDEAHCTCEIEINELVFKARLNAAERSIKGFLIIPGTGSLVLAGRLDENADIWVILAYTVVDKIIMREGSNGGLVISSDLVTRLNNIEQDLNTLKQIFTAWAPVTQDGGAALKTAASQWCAQQLNETVVSDIEDDKILH